MLLVDYRAGSKELVVPLRHLGLTVDETTLDFGDVAFQGRGDKDAPVDVGIEFKQLEELLASLRSGRFVGHQLIGLRNTFEHSWLLVEGEYRVDTQSGLILTLQWSVKKRRKDWLPVRPRFTISELEKQMLTLQLKGGLHVQFTQTRTDSLRYLHNLYRWFTDVAFDAHTSHLAIYRAPTLLPISVFRQVVSGIPGVGFKASLAAEKRFKTIRRAVNARPEEWAAVSTIGDDGKGKRLGEKVASRIDKALGDK
jgi:ERCC4-type nuclease